MNAPISKQLQTCYVLHRRPYSNSSLLIELFIHEHGKIAAIAKGARKSRSSFRSHLQPFRKLLVMLAGKGEVMTLTRVEPGGPALELSGQRLYCGFYINELTLRLLQRNDPHEALFCDYAEALTGLGQGGDVERILRRFELRLLCALGYGMCLDTEALSGEKVVAERVYRYALESGVVPHQKNNHSAEIIQGKTLLGLSADLELDAVARKEARILLRRILSHYLGDKPLKSRELFRVFGESRNYDRKN